MSSTSVGSMLFAYFMALLPVTAPNMGMFRCGIHMGVWHSMLQVVSSKPQDSAAGLFQDLSVMSRLWAAVHDRTMQDICEFIPCCTRHWPDTCCLRSRQCEFISYPFANLPSLFPIGCISVHYCVSLLAPVISGNICCIVALFFF